MKTTNKNSFVRKFAEWVSKHPYSFLQTVFLILLGLSLIWILREPLNFFDKGFWIKMEGYIPAFLFPLVLLAAFSPELNSRLRPFAFTVLWGYLLVLSWCTYWEISYIFPIIAAGTLTGFYYNKIRKDRPSEAKRLFWVSIIVWGLGGFGSSLGFSYWGQEQELKEQNYARQAIEIPAIKVIDSKDNLIYTEEYGLEKIKSYHSIHIPKGCMVHRLQIEDGMVFVLPE